jgi:CRP-like cAMP-binding protein
MPVDPSVLAGLGVFAELTDAQLQQVARAAEETALPRGHEIGVEGDLAKHFFVISSGSADVVQHGERLRGLGPGDFFGEIGLLATGHRTATVVATTALRLVVVPERTFLRLEQSVPEFGRRVRAALDARLSG